MSRDAIPQLWKAGDGMVSATGKLLIAQAFCKGTRTCAAGVGVAGTQGRACPLEYCPAGEIAASLSPRHL